LPSRQDVLYFTTSDKALRAAAIRLIKDWVVVAAKFDAPGNLHGGSAATSCRRICCRTEGGAASLLPGAQCHDHDQRAAAASAAPTSTHEHPAEFLLATASCSAECQWPWIAWIARQRHPGNAAMKSHPY